MGNFDIKLGKYAVYAVYFLVVCILLNTCNSCNANKENSRLRKEVTGLSLEMDSLKSSVYTKEELNIRMEIEGLRTSKRSLYYENAIIRTAIRPDDAMNELDEKIESLQKELNK